MSDPPIYHSFKKKKPKPQNRQKDIYYTSVICCCFIVTALRKDVTMVSPNISIKLGKI